MIEVVDRDRCIACDRCVDVCPTRVFDRGPDGIPVIARHDSCQTCFQCEAYCPTDALFARRWRQGRQRTRLSGTPPN